jgi:mRNA interferase MazF
VPLTGTDFVSGSLPVDSFVRPNKIFSADKNIILSTAGHVADIKIAEVVNTIVDIIKS